MTQNNQKWWSVFSIQCVRSRMHMPAHVPLVWCMWKIACITSVYDTYCLGHWNEENTGNKKTSDWIVDHFSLIFVNLLLAWMMNFYVWIQNKGKFLVWIEYYNQFGIYQPSCVFLLEPRQSNWSTQLLL